MIRVVLAYRIRYNGQLCAWKHDLRHPARVRVTASSSRPSSFIR